MTTALHRPLETGWLDDTPVEDSLLRRFLHNQGDLGVLLATSAGGDAEVGPDLMMGWYATDVAYNNQAVALRPLTPDLLDRVDRFYAGRPRGATLLSAWPTEDLRGRGWQLVGHPMLVVRPAGHLEVPARPGVSVEVCSDPAELEQAERIAIEAYPMPGATPGTAFSQGLLSSPYLVRTGWLDGRPVAVGASHVARGVQNLCLAGGPGQRRAGAAVGGVHQRRLAARVPGAGVPAGGADEPVVPRSLDSGG
jgi:hypothetical protein